MKKQDFLKAFAIAVVVMIFAAVGAIAVLNKDDKTTSAETTGQETKSTKASKDSDITNETISDESSSNISSEESSSQPVSSKSTSSKSTSSKSTSSKTPSSNSEPAQSGLKYVDGILIVNKTYSVPKNYGNGLTAETSAAFRELQAAAKKDGLNLWIASGYRSYSRQQTLYTNYCNQSGKAAADRFSARPGNSEHQTGLAIDVNNPSSSFEGTPEAIWLEKNCTQFGFIIRYGKGKEASTGFKYEPWHIRYVGKDLAKKITASGKSIEEYYGLTSVYPN